MATKYLVIAGAVLLVFAFAVPMALAHPEEDREAKREKADKPEKAEKAEGKERNKTADREAREAKADEKKAKRLPSNFTLELSGSAFSKKGNVTYSFEMVADGKARMKQDEDKVRFLARGLAHVKVLDENGTVVKQGDVRIQVAGHSDDNGTVHWKLVSMAKKAAGMPRLVLKGEAQETAAGSFDLEGKGRGVVKLGDDKRAIPLRLEASGKLAIEVPA